MSLAEAPKTTVARRPHVWIVDDSPLEAELVRRSLVSICTVDLFTDAAAMLEHASSAAPPDALIIDWEMPGISGIEVCQFLRTRAATQSVPILMLTVHNETRDLVQGLAAGADDFLTKPYNAAELSARVSALIRAKRMRDRADRAERTVGELLMQLPEAIVSVDAEGTIVFANLEAARMLERDPESLQGLRLLGLVDGLVIASAAVPGAGPASDASPGSVALPDVRRGDRIYAPVLRTYAGLDAHQTTFSFRDVTGERRHDAERARLLEREREARSEAEAANRAKDEFLAIVSHELRTPLNAMLGWMRLLRGGALPESKHALALQTVERNALAQKKLVEDILDISRIVSGNLRLSVTPIELEPCIRTAVDAIRPTADLKSITVAVDFAADVAAISGDADRLQQMVWNLLSNAVKFSPNGSTVRLDAVVEGGSVVVRVRDQGEGIEPSFLPHIFERFRQEETGTTRQHGGLGLGLAIVKHLAELHRGTIEARSEGRGTGATFTLRLPIFAPARASEPLVAVGRDSPLPLGTGNGAGQAAGAAAGLHGVRCLVVEDDEDTRELIVTILEQEGATVTAVGSTAEAMATVTRRAPHVIVSDIGLPVEDGYALANRLRAHPARETEGMRAMALTAFASTQDRERAMSAGFDAFVAKPVSPVELLATVGRLAGRLR